MTCNELEHWLATRDIFELHENSEAIKHIGSCDACRALYNMDLSLENRIKSAFKPDQLPETLFNRIDIALENPVYDKSK